MTNKNKTNIKGLKEIERRYVVHNKKGFATGCIAAGLAIGALCATTGVFAYKASNSSSQTSSSVSINKKEKFLLGLNRICSNNLTVDYTELNLASVKSSSNDDLVYNTFYLKNDGENDHLYYDNQVRGLATDYYTIREKDTKVNVLKQFNNNYYAYDNTTTYNIESFRNRIVTLLGKITFLYPSFSWSENSLIGTSTIGELNTASRRVVSELYDKKIDVKIEFNNTYVTSINMLTAEEFTLPTGVFVPAGAPYIVIKLSDYDKTNISELESVKNYVAYDSSEYNEVYNSSSPSVYSITDGKFGTKQDSSSSLNVNEKYLLVIDHGDPLQRFNYENSGFKVLLNDQEIKLELENVDGDTYYAFTPFEAGDIIIRSQYKWNVEYEKCVFTAK